MSRTVDVYPDLATASGALADDLEARATEAVAARGRFRWVISGGSTPLPLYRLLAGRRGRRIPWESTEVFFADERCVPPHHPDSNFGSAWATLLAKVPVRRRWIHRMRGELRPASRAASDYARRLEPLPSPTGTAPPRFDLVHLGIGPDGHTASLFPNAAALTELRRAVVAVPRAGQPPYVPRLTMTVGALESSRAVAFLVSGRDKGRALRAIFGSRVRGTPNWPASLVRPVVGVRWLLDDEAAEALPDSVVRNVHP